MDNLEETDDFYYSLPTNFDDIVALTAAQSGHSPMELLLLDSCSTLNLISNPRLVHDIHEVPKGIVVHCNAGDVYVDKKA